jgi:hypothetical protein
MKFINSLLFLLFFVFATAGAQTKVVKKNAAKSTDYGVEYFLPKTVLTVEVSYGKITQKAGPYAKYAKRFLGLDEKSVISEDAVYYTLDKANVESKGVPDKKEAYLIEFKAKTTSPFVYLTEDGMICTINADYVPEVVQKQANPVAATKLPAINAHSVFTEEYLRAGSTLKMAEVASKQIYRLRESRTDILTGDADNPPRDGEGMKIVLENLEAREKILTELFTGTTAVETMTSEFEVEPLAEINKEVLFRFSKHLGIVEADDLSGNPVYINVKQIESKEEPEIADLKKKGKEQASIVFNVPGKGLVELFLGANSLYKNTFQIVQFGEKQVLATSLFDDKKVPVKIYFYPNTGSIRQIIQ